MSAECGITDLARRCRAAQRAYYAARVPPTEKRDLLIAARIAEQRLDRALDGIVTDEGQEWPQPLPTLITEGSAV